MNKHQNISINSHQAKRKNTNGQKLLVAAAAGATIVASGSTSTPTPTPTITMSATAGDDVIVLGAYDTIGIVDGLAGDDTITGGDLADFIRGNSGVDNINGGAGVDNIVVIGTTDNAGYTLSDIQNPNGTGIDLSVLLNLDAVNNNAVSDISAGEIIDGGVDGARLFVYGNVDFTNATLANITRIDVQSEIIISATQLKALIDSGKFQALIGDGTSEITITNDGTAIALDFSNIDMQNVKQLTIPANITLLLDQDDLRGLTTINGAGTIKATSGTLDTSGIAVDSAVAVEVASTPTPTSTVPLNTFTAKVVAGFQTNDGANDATEGNDLSTGADILNATVTQTNDATTDIDGLAGADTFNISGTNTADISTGQVAGFTNIETINLQTGVTGLTIDAADISSTQVTNITGVSGTAQTLSLKHNNNTGDLSELTLREVETINYDGTSASSAEFLALDEDNLTDVTAINLTVAGGDLSLTANGDGIFDFSNIALNFTGGVTQRLILSGGSNDNKIATLDAADIVNLSRIDGSNASAAVTTLAFNDSVDLTSRVMTNTDTFKFTGANANQTLSLKASQFGNNPYFSTIIGSGDDNLVITISSNLDLTQTSISGFDTIAFGDDLPPRIIKLDAASISDNVTLSGDTDASFDITEAGDYTNLTLTANDFDDLLLSQSSGTVVVDNGMFSGAIDNIDGNGSIQALTINMDTTTTLNLGGINLGASNDVAVTINDTSGDDTIEAFLTSSSGSTTTISLANGGNDTVKLNAQSGNATDEMNIADAVKVTGFNANSGSENDKISIDTGLTTVNNTSAHLGGSINQDTRGFVLLLAPNKTMGNFSDIVELSGELGTISNENANDLMVFAISNDAQTEVAIYAVKFNNIDHVVDVLDDVTLLSIVSYTGGLTIDKSDFALF